MKPTLRSRVRAALAALTGKRASAFYGAEMSRLFTDWLVGLRSINEDIRADAKTLLKRSRDLAKNNGYAKHYLTMIAVNVIGPHGFTFQAKVRNAAGDLRTGINKQLEAAWNRWACGRVTTDGRLTLVQFERLAIKTVARDGEAFVRKVVDPALNRFGLSLQLIDVALVDHTYNRPAGSTTNEIRMGIEIDRLGRAVQFWIWSTHEGQLNAAPRVRYSVPASEMLHLYDPEYADQTRGYTWLHAGMASVKVLDAYEEAELFAARLSAAKIGFFQSKDGAELGAMSAAGTKEPQEMEASPGVLTKLPVGWEFQGWDPQHPTGAFPAFVKAIMRKIATSWGVSYNSLANDLEGVNYSSMRSGLLVERDVWRTLQRWWVDCFRTPLYEAWLPVALLTDEIALETRDPRAYRAVEWQPRGWQWVDPEKEANASITAIKAGLDSRIAVLAEQGKDFETILEQLAEEKALAKLAGVSIEEVDAAAKPKATSKEDEPANGNGDGDEESDADRGNRLAHLLRAAGRE